MTRYANINAYAQYDFGFGLTAKATFSYGYTNSRFDGYQYAYQIYTYDEASDTYNGTNAAGRWRLQIDRSVPTRYMQLPETFLVENSVDAAPAFCSQWHNGWALYTGKNSYDFLYLVGRYVHQHVFLVFSGFDCIDAEQQFLKYFLLFV